MKSITALKSVDGVRRAREAGSPIRTSLVGKGKISALFGILVIGGSF
jgi:hypothetical protein